MSYVNVGSTISSVATNSGLWHSASLSNATAPQKNMMIAGVQVPLLSDYCSGSSAVAVAAATAAVQGPQLTVRAVAPQKGIGVLASLTSHAAAAAAAGERLQFVGRAVAVSLVQHVYATASASVGASSPPEVSTAVELTPYHLHVPSVVQRSSGPGASVVASYNDKACFDPLEISEDAEEPYDDSDPLAWMGEGADDREAAYSSGKADRPRAVYEFSIYGDEDDDVERDDVRAPSPVQRSSEPAASAAVPDHSNDKAYTDFMALLRADSDDLEIERLVKELGITPGQYASDSDDEEDVAMLKRLAQSNAGG